MSMKDNLPTWGTKLNSQYEPKSLGWVKKCQRYFSMFSVAEDQKVDIASMYLVGKAETWYDGYILQKHRTTWPEFVVDLCQRFCDRTWKKIILCPASSVD